MNGESRTTKSIKNSSMALIFYVINLILQFFSRKIFIDYLGTEILGLNTTATSLLQFLNLAELGIGSAVGFSLYKPFYDGDEQAINEIVALQGKLYRHIAYIVIICAVVLMCFFPQIFANMKLPLWYAYASFGVLLFSALLSYFVNYKQILLSADQKEYKIQYSFRTSMIVKTIAQMLAVRFLANGYEWWLVIEAVFALIASFVVNHTVNLTYPFLRPCKKTLKELDAEYPIVKVKIRQVFFHKIGYFALSQVSPVIIYAFASLTTVSLYGNYMLLVTGLINLTNVMTNSVTASIGNLMIERDDNRVMRVFEELFSLRFLLASVLCFGMVTLCQPFISLWIGPEYLLPNSTLMILSTILFIQIFRHAVDSYITACGFFSDVWSPIIEMSLNIGLSILLGSFFGLNGILSGVLISLIAVIVCWKPIFLFAVKLKYGFRRYAKIFVLHFFCSVFAAIPTYIILQSLPVEPQRGIWEFLIYGMTGGMVYFGLLAVLLYANKSGFYFLCQRFYKFYTK